MYQQAADIASLACSFAGGRAVSRFNAMKYADVAHLFNGSKSGLLRDPHSERNEPYVIRYPTKDLIIHPSRSYMKDAPRINFTVQDLERCTDFELVKSMWDFMLCIDLASSRSGRAHAAPEVLSTAQHQKQKPAVC
eukprot:351557-Chlamydomonas_euryale.AAC.18